MMTFSSFVSMQGSSYRKFNFLPNLNFLTFSERFRLAHISASEHLDARVLAGRLWTCFQTFSGGNVLD
jgi:hypothetical protein